ncbi:MAG: hypothetical protein SV760_05240, partial [Halobacteria archaeon]|nr:hypothetical protein [Halobacteria archaeon]
MQKHEKELLDELLIEEYRSFVEDPYAYEFDRETARDELGNDGFLDDESFENVCERFENRYLDASTRDASPTFSKHGLERARLLGE